MRKLRSNRRLGIESLENRVVFADDLVMIDVNLLIQWNLVAADSDYAIEHKDMIVSVSPDRLALYGEGEWYRNGVAGTSLEPNTIAGTSESLLSTSPSIDTSISPHTSVSALSHSTESTNATHHLRETITRVSATFKMTTDVDEDATTASDVGTSEADSITSVMKEETGRSLARKSLSSVGIEMPFQDEIPGIQSAQPTLLTDSAASRKEIGNSSEIGQQIDDSLKLQENRQRTSESRNLLASVASRLGRRQGTLLVEDDRKDLFAESFYAISLPAANNHPADQSWSLLFGVAQTSPPLSTNTNDAEMSTVRRAVLEIVSEIERANLTASAPSATSSSNTWKATTLLAAALTATFYRNKKQQDHQVPSLLSRIRPERVPTKRTYR